MNRLWLDNLVALKRDDFHFYMPDREEEAVCNHGFPSGGTHAAQYAAEHPDAGSVAACDLDGRTDDHTHTADEYGWHEQEES